MNIVNVMRDTIVVRSWSEGSDDIFGDAIDVFQDDQGHPASVRRISSTEDIIDRDTTKSQYICEVPPNVAVTATDQIIWNGVVHRVVGDPEVLNDWQGSVGVRCIIESISDQSAESSSVSS